MRLLALVLTFAASAAMGAAWAQEKPAPKEPAKPAAQPAAEKPAVARKAASSKRGEDARHCLEKASNTEVIKCAEAYL